MEFKKKDRKDDGDDRGSNVAVVDAAPRVVSGGTDGTAYSVSANGDQQASDTDPGSSVLTAQPECRSGPPRSTSTGGEKIATPFKGQLGDLLIDSELITDEQLQEALEKQIESGGKLGEVLVEMGALDARALADALAAVLGLEVLNLRRENVDPDALALVSEKVARSQLAIPVRFEGNFLQAAVAEPSEDVRAMLAKESGRQVQLMLAPLSDVIWAIDSNYRAIGSVGQLVEAFVAVEGLRRRASDVAETEIVAVDAPVVQVVDRILTQAMRDRASDVHIEASEEFVRVRFRAPSILKQTRHARNAPRSDGGFTLIELIIVSLITPIIIGALAAGLVAVFSLQSSAASRLSDTGDSQVVLASYEPDVQSAQTITTATQGSPQCGTGTEMLGMEWNLDATTGFYQTVVSYVEVANGSSNPTTVNLVRQFCKGNGTTEVGPSTLVSSSILSYDLPQNQVAPVVSCNPTIACANISTQYITTAPVTNVSFGITEPKSNYSYTMVATPSAAAAVIDTGSPITSSTLTSCGFASPGSGYYASTMCFVDFAPLTGAALRAANTTGTCLEMSVQLPEAYTLYFCINISGPILASNSPPLAHDLPTWTNGFLGNNVNGLPFYTGVPGNPALYENVQGATDIITFSNITVINPQGVPATGWEATSADAESTDLNESITWNSNVPLTVIPNNQTGVTEPVGNACQNGTDLTGNGTTTVECYGGNPARDPSVGTKTGTAMVEAETPTTLVATLVGGGLQGITFGLMLS